MALRAPGCHFQSKLTQTIKNKGLGFPFTKSNPTKADPRQPHVARGTRKRSGEKSTGHDMLNNRFSKLGTSPADRWVQERGSYFENPAKWSKQRSRHRSHLLPPDHASKWLACLEVLLEPGGGGSLETEEVLNHCQNYRNFMPIAREHSLRLPAFPPLAILLQGTKPLDFRDLPLVNFQHKKQQVLCLSAERWRPPINSLFELPGDPQGKNRDTLSG